MITFSIETAFSHIHVTGNTGDRLFPLLQERLTIIFEIGHEMILLASTAALKYIRSKKPDIPPNDEALVAIAMKFIPLIEKKLAHPRPELRSSPPIELDKDELEWLLIFQMQKRRNEWREINDDRLFELILYVLIPVFRNMIFIARNNMLNGRTCPNPACKKSFSIVMTKSSRPKEVRSMSLDESDDQMC